MNPRRLERNVQHLLGDGEQAHAAARSLVRPRWLEGVAIVVGLAVFLGLQAAWGLGGFVQGGLAGGAIGLTMGAGQTSYVLARCDRRGVYCHASRWMGTPRSIAGEFALGSVDYREQFLVDRITVDGVSMQVPRGNRARMKDVLGIQN